MQMTRADIIKSVIQSYLRTKYKWGGFDPDGIDCSGLCQEILWSVGMLPDSVDRTAHSLWLLYSKHGFLSQELPDGRDLGCLVFFKPNGESNRITHCEMVVSKLPKLISLGARGGRFTKGRVMYRPVEGRHNMTLVGFSDVWALSNKLEEANGTR